MSRVVFPLVILAALFTIVPIISHRHRLGRDEPETAFALQDPARVVDVDVLRTRTGNRDLRLAGDRDLALLRSNATVGRLVRLLDSTSTRERRLAAATLGAAGLDDGVLPLIRAFETEHDELALASMAMALAESGSPEAVRTLIQAIRDARGLSAYHAYQALKTTFGLDLGLEADDWERWFEASLAAHE
jgi:HEAT repeat protein